MKITLGNLLLQAIRAKGGLTIEEVELVAHRAGSKVDTGFREMRKLAGKGLVLPNRNAKGVITGYLAINIEPLSVPAASHNLQEALFKVRHLI